MLPERLYSLEWLLRSRTYVHLCRIGPLPYSRGSRARTFFSLQDAEAMVTCMDETRHGLEDGDFVTFEEVAGMTDLNGCEPRKITVKGGSSRRAPPRVKSHKSRPLPSFFLHLGPYTFTIGDTTGLSKYTAGGVFTQVKMPKIITFVRSASFASSPPPRPRRSSHLL